MYLANVGNGGSDYTGFRLTPDGALRPIPGSTVALPSGSQPGDVLFNGTGTNLVGIPDRSLPVRLVTSPTSLPGPGAPVGIVVT